MKGALRLSRMATRPATRNIGRLSEIAQVAVKHGFGYFFERHRLTDLFPWISRDGAEMPSEDSHAADSSTFLRLWQ